MRVKFVARSQRLDPQSPKTPSADATPTLDDSPSVRLRPGATRGRGGAGGSAAVDGIRGIGVMTVLLYRAGLSALAGAFLDMEMFLVTSGLLITMLLHREYQRWVKVPLRGFWLGRGVEKSG